MEKKEELVHTELHVELEEMLHKYVASCRKSKDVALKVCLYPSL